MFVGKYCFNTVLDVDFLEGIRGEIILSRLPFLAMYLGLAAFVALPWCISTHRAAKQGCFETQYERGGFHPSGIALAACFVLPAALLTLAISRGINPLQNPLKFRQMIQGGGLAYFMLAFIFLATLMAVYIPYKTLVLKRGPSIVEIVAYFTLLGFAAISGFASFLIIFFLSPLYFLSACYGKRVEIAMAAAVPALVIFVLIYTAYRDARLHGDNVSVSSAVEKFTGDVSVLRFAMNRFDYLETFVKGQLYLRDEHPDLGASLVAVVFQPVPRSLWSEKPDNLSTSLTKELLPQNYEIGVTANFNSLNEFYKSFGSTGIVVGGIFLGLVLAKSYNIYYKSRNDPYTSVYYVTTVFPYVALGFVAGYINDLALPLLIMNNLFFIAFVRRSGAGISEKV